MKKINFVAIHEAIVRWLGKRTATRLCGENMASTNPEPEQSYVYGSLFAPLIDEYPGSYTRIMGTLSKDCRDQLLKAIMLTNGVDPLWKLRRYRSDKSTLASTFLNALDYFRLKALYPSENIESLIVKALAELKTADVLFETHSHHKIGALMLLRVINGRWLDPEYAFLEPIVAIDASYEVIHKVANEYFMFTRSKETKCNGNWNRVDDSVLTDLFLGQTDQLFQAWRLVGHDFESIFRAMEIRASVQLDMGKLDYPAERVDELKRIKRAYMLAGFPDQYEKFGVKTSDFLGERLLEKASVRDKGDHYVFDYMEHTYGTAVISRYLDDIHVKKLLASLVSHLPDLYEPSYCVYSGSRSIQWCNAIKDISPIAPLLNAMKQEDVWHPLINRKEFVEVASNESVNQIIKDFLEEGTKWRLTQAEGVVEAGRIDFKAIIPTLSLKKHFVNLAKIHIPTPEEYALIPEKYRKDFLREQLDI